jgi:hypothetical protein
MLAGALHHPFRDVDPDDGASVLLSQKSRCKTDTASDIEDEGSLTDTTVPGKDFGGFSPAHVFCNAQLRLQVKIGSIEPKLFVG